MVIRRCAWHCQYFGHPKYYRIDSWRGGLAVSYTDGICGRCAARMRAEPAPTARLARTDWLAVVRLQRAVLTGAAVTVISIVSLPGTFLDETLWRPATVIMIPARVPEARPDTARRAPVRPAKATRTRLERAGVARFHPGTRGVLDPLIAWAGTTEVVTEAATPDRQSTLRDDPLALPTLEETWAISVSNNGPELPLGQKGPLLLALSYARPEGRVEAP